MASSNTKTNGGAAERADATPAKATVKYPLARLRRDCRKLYGISTSTFDGAAAGRKPTDEFTAAEMGQIIKDWQSTPIRHIGKEDK